MVKYKIILKYKTFNMLQVSLGCVQLSHLNIKSRTKYKINKLIHDKPFKFIYEDV